MLKAQDSSKKGGQDGGLLSGSMVSCRIIEFFLSLLLW